MNLEAWEKLAAEALERAEQATKAPWTAGDGRRTEPGEVEVLAPDGSEIATCWPDRQVANAEFMAKARDDVPDLAKALLEATAEIRKLRAANPFDDLLAKLDAEAGVVPMGARIDGGPLHGTSLFNAYQWAACTLRRLSGRPER